MKIKNIISKISNYYGGGKPQYGKIKLRKDESKIIYANINKIKNELKWKPKTRFDYGMKKTFIYYDKKK